MIGTGGTSPGPGVEIVRGLETSDATHDAAAALAEQLGKSPITVKSAPGFVVNRILLPMINEAFFVLAEGYASAEDIAASVTPTCMPPRAIGRQSRRCRLSPAMKVPESSRLAARAWLA